MPNYSGFNRPSFTEILARRRDGYSNNTGGDAALFQGVLPRLAEATAEGQHALHGHLDWASRQAMPMLAEGLYLDLWGRLWGVSRLPATYAAGTVTFTGTDGAGVVAGAEIRRADGELFTVTASAVVAGGVVSVPVQAKNFGDIGNTAAASTLTLISPVAGLSPAATVGGGGLIGGADEEMDGKPGTSEGFRGRIRARITAPPHGGNDSDYKKWAKAISGVTRVWVEANGLGAGTVVVRFMMDDTYANGIPAGTGAPAYSGDIKSVFDHIESHADELTGDLTGRPATAEVFVLAPTPVPLDVTITGLSPDTPEIRGAIENELQEMILFRSSPGGVIRTSWIWEAVSDAAGEDSHVITIPAADITYLPGEIAVMGTVTYA